MDKNPEAEFIRELAERNRSERDSEKFVERYYLKELGIDWDYLKGKKILEIGAGLAELSKFAKEKGIDVVSVDLDVRKEEDIDKKGPLGKDLFVQGDIYKLPFPDNTFDLVISKSAPPVMATSGGEDVAAVLKEAKRVLKDGGRFVFGPAGIVWIDESVPEAGKKGFGGGEAAERDAERSAEVVKKSYDLLKNIDPDITLHTNGLAAGDFPAGASPYAVYSRTRCYSLVKKPAGRAAS